MRCRDRGRSPASADLRAPELATSIPPRRGRAGAPTGAPDRVQILNRRRIRQDGRGRRPGPAPRGPVNDALDAAAPATAGSSTGTWPASSPAADGRPDRGRYAGDRRALAVALSRCWEGLGLANLPNLTLPSDQMALPSDGCRADRLARHCCDTDRAVRGDAMTVKPPAPPPLPDELDCDRSDACACHTFAERRRR